VLIGNERSPDADEAAEFVPKSIKSRVETLGGSLEVRHTERGYTVVHATLPAE
jgi:signal transduction histidine kinase